MQAVSPACLAGTYSNACKAAPLGLSGRYARIESVVQQVFDVPFMTRVAVGPEWERLNDAQHQHIGQAFARYIAAIHAERFDSYAGEALRVTCVQPSSSNTVVITTSSIRMTLSVICRGRMALPGKSSALNCTVRSANSQPARSLVRSCAREGSAA
jgi:hypothetical protein